MAVCAGGWLRFEGAPELVDALERLSRRADLPLSSESLAPEVA